MSALGEFKETPNVETRATMSQAGKELSEGATTNAYLPEREMKRHERPAPTS